MATMTEINRAIFALPMKSVTGAMNDSGAKICTIACNAIKITGNSAVKRLIPNLGSSYSLNFLGLNRPFGISISNASFLNNFV
jgi:hypothetical protein